MEPCALLGRICDEHPALVLPAISCQPCFGREEDMDGPVKPIWKALF
jgi:hypothetical protein